MLETLESLDGTQGGQNPQAKSISKKDVLAGCLAWAIEGEGCISAAWRMQTNPAYKGDNTLTTRVTIHNTHPLFITDITKMLCELGIKFCVVLQKGPKATRHGISICILGKGRVKKLLNLIMPYLASKKRRAELVLELIDYRESLAIKGMESKGRYGKMHLWEDPKILELLTAIKEEIHNYPSVLNCSRKASAVFNESSETLRFPREINEMIKSDLHGDMQLT